MGQSTNLWHFDMAMVPMSGLAVALYVADNGFLYREGAKKHKSGPDPEDTDVDVDAVVKLDEDGEASETDGIENDDLEPGFDIRHINPRLTDADRFVVEVEVWTLNHLVWNRRLLDCFPAVACPGWNPCTATHYMKAYANLTRRLGSFLATAKTLAGEVRGGSILDQMVSILLEVHTSTTKAFDNVCGLQLWDEASYTSIAKPVVEAFGKHCFSARGCAQSSVAAVYFGSVLISPLRCNSIVEQLCRHGCVTQDDIPLPPSRADTTHCSMERMRSLVATMAATRSERQEILQAVRLIMAAQVQLLEDLVVETLAADVRGGARKK